MYIEAKKCILIHECIFIYEKHFIFILIIIEKPNIISTFVFNIKNNLNQLKLNNETLH